MRRFARFAQYSHNEKLSKTSNTSLSQLDWSGYLSPMLTKSNPNGALKQRGRNAIHISSRDKELLEDLLAEVEASGSSGRGDLKALRGELQRAIVVEPHDVPDDVITMNSRAEIVDLETGETVTFTLVFPLEANVDEEKISVLAPIGAGMLGYRVGDEFEWNVPAGLRRMKVTKVHYQPEAAGVFDR
jgi:regulator of nucleoside diphosphate kinase